MKKNQRIEKDAVKFGAKVTIEFGFDFKNVSIANRQLRLFHVKFWLFFRAV